MGARVVTPPVPAQSSCAPPVSGAGATHQQGCCHGSRAGGGGCSPAFFSPPAPDLRLLLNHNRLSEGSLPRASLAPGAPEPLRPRRSSKGNTEMVAPAPASCDTHRSSSLPADALAGHGPSPTSARLFLGEGDTQAALGPPSLPDLLYFSSLHSITAK